MRTLLVQRAEAIKHQGKIMELQGQLKFWKEQKEQGKEAESAIKVITDVLNKYEEIATQLDYPRLICELRDQEDTVIEELTLLVIDLIKSVNVSAVPGASQIETIVYAIYEKFGMLSLEDIARCFYEAKTGEHKEIFRLDILVITRWLELYKNALNTHLTAQNERIHASSKVDGTAGRTAEKFDEKTYSGIKASVYRERMLNARSGKS